MWKEAIMTYFKELFLNLSGAVLLNLFKPKDQ
jgi:hypothetical protein